MEDGEHGERPEMRKQEDRKSKGRRVERKASRVAMDSPAIPLPVVVAAAESDSDMSKTIKNRKCHQRCLGVSGEGEHCTLAPEFEACDRSQRERATMTSALSHVSLVTASNSSDSCHCRQLLKREGERAKSSLGGQISQSVIVRRVKKRDQESVSEWMA